MTFPRRGSPSLVAFLAVALAASGCGSGETELSAEEFIAEMNESGAGLELGGPLATENRSEETYSIEIADAEDDADARATGEAHGHSGGAVVVTGDESSALAFYRRCSAAPALVCYRAANVVLYHEQDLGRAVQRRIRRAILRMSD